MRVWRGIVLVFSAAIVSVWLALRWRDIASDPDGTVGLVLGLFFGALILLRPKADSVRAWAPPWRTAVLGLAGTLLAVAGIVFSVGHFEWIGLLMVVGAGLRWALPDRFARDILLALFLFYWIHPLPSQISGQLHLAMQYLSIQGAEWLLHGFNVRAWADGLILRTATVAIGVPEACSGLKTATTVAVSCLGTALLLRFKPRHVVALVSVGILQVLAMNTLRIFAAAMLAPAMGTEWARGFLHDSLGAFLIAAVLLVQIEAAFAWSRQRARERRETPDAKRRFRHYPPFWRALLLWRWVIVGGLLGLAVTGAAAYKRQPYHRSEMIRGILNDMLATDLENSQRAALAALRFNESNTGLRSELARILMLRRMYDEGLDELRKIPRDKFGAFQTILKAWGMMGKGSADKAIALLDGLSEGERDLPSVAIIRAEFAATQDDTVTVTTNVVKAMRADSALMLERVRTLFPYLGARRQWLTIVKCHRPVPYRDPSQALVAVSAHFQTGSAYLASRILKQVAESWPDDPRAMDYFLTMAILKPGSEWEDLFAESFRKHVNHLDSDQLTAHMAHCLTLGRQDLVALASKAIQAISPQDPAVSLMMSMAPGAGAEERKKYIETSLAELDKKEREKQTSLRMRMMYPAALAVAGRYGDAHAKLDEIERAFPGTKPEVVFRHMVFYEMARDWENAYEAAREYLSLVGRPNLAATLTTVKSLFGLRFGVYALGPAQAAQRTFPESRSAAHIVAATMEACGWKEEALFTLGKMPEALRTPAGAGLLYATERFKEARKIAKETGRSDIVQAVPKIQRVVLAPAELTVMRVWEAPMTGAEMDREAGRLEAEAKQSTSPFFKAIKRTAAEWYGVRGQGKASSVETWQSAGRDAMERAIALNELAVLLARQREYGKASAASARAVELQPNSSVLWRTRIALSLGEGPIVGQARAACPSDPDIWLAGLIVRTRETADGGWAKSLIERAVAENRFSVGTMVRAGDFLWRSGMAGAASVAARHAIKCSPDFLPAYVLGMRCALVQQDHEWALACARSASENAIDPAPFLQAIVDTKLLTKTIDADLVIALGNLQKRHPVDPQWARRLAGTYQRTGKMEEFFSILTPLAGDTRPAVQAGALVLKAEIARIDGRNDEAVSLLQTAYAQQPQNLSVLNNLIYSLAQDAKTLPRARELLPGLLGAKPPTFSFLDTAALVFLRSGEFEQARRYAEEALRLVQKNDYGWAEVNLNMVELDIRQGKYDEAQRRLSTIVAEQRKPELIERRAWELTVGLKKATSDPQ